MKTAVDRRRNGKKTFIQSRKRANVFRHALRRLAIMMIVARARTPIKPELRTERK